MVPEVIWSLGNFVAHLVCVVAMIGGGAVCIALVAEAVHDFGVSDSDTAP